MLVPGVLLLLILRLQGPLRCSQAAPGNLVAVAVVGVMVMLLHVVHLVCVAGWVGMLRQVLVWLMLVRWLAAGPVLVLLPLVLVLRVVVVLLTQRPLLPQLLLVPLRGVWRGAWPAAQTGAAQVAYARGAALGVGGALVAAGALAAGGAPVVAGALVQAELGAAWAVPVGWVWWAHPLLWTSSWWRPGRWRPL